MQLTLPLATRAEVRGWARSTLRGNRRDFAVVTVLFGFASIAGLAGPQLLGYLVDVVLARDGANIDLLVLAFAVILLVQAAFKRVAYIRAGKLGERVLARTREEFVGEALRLPLGTVEAAGTGDLLTRSTSDVSRIDLVVRRAAPEMLIAGATVLLTVLAMIITSPLLALGLLVALPTLVLPTRWYLRRAPRTIEEMLAQWSQVNSGMHETVEGARTAEALCLTGRRVRLGEEVLQGAVGGERRLRRLQVVWTGWLNLSHVLPVAAMLLLGGVLYANGLVELGAVTTLVLYQQALASPVEELLWWLEDIAVASTALRRVLGVRSTDEPRTGTAPTGQDIEVRDVRFEYNAGHEVLHGIDLCVPQGQRLAVVGPSGAGKSTLGRLLAGIAAPTAGSVTIGGVEVSSLPDGVLRGEVLLLTQEHHVFAGTLRENLTLPGDGRFTDAQLVDALDVVGLSGWLASLPDGLDSKLDTGQHAVPAAVAQQLALARVVLADPHTLVLDEATSLLDTSSARDLERTLATVLAGRTVIAIAHRLHTAAAADQVAVLENGRITELGSHDELLAAAGSYARLVSTAQSGHAS